MCLLINYGFINSSQREDKKHWKKGKGKNKEDTNCYVEQILKAAFLTSKIKFSKFLSPMKQMPML